MLAWEMLDAFYMPRFNLRRGDELIQLHPQALSRLQAARSGGKGVILALCHYGRLNMLALRLALAGEEMSILTMVTDERNTDLDRLQQRYINRKVATLMRFLGGRWITLADDLRALYKELQQGSTLVILLDAYTPERTQQKIQLPFLGGHLTLSAGIQRLAERTGAQIIYGVTHERSYKLQAELRTLPAEPELAMIAAVQELERDVLAAPWLWWQWGVLDGLWAAPTEVGAGQVTAGAVS